MPLHLHLIQSGVQVEALQGLKGMQLTQPTTTSCTVAHSRRECGLRVVSASGLPAVICGIVYASRQGRRI